MSTDSGLEFINIIIICFNLSDRCVLLGLYIFQIMFNVDMTYM